MTFLQHVTGRESSAKASASFARINQVTTDHVLRLCLDKELVGHKGCVNCLEWTNCGRILASGSDDQCVNLWNPHRSKLLQSLRTQHAANVFSVKFLPESDDHLLATGAADAKVTVVDVEQKETVNVFSCHIGRVKRLAVAPGLPAVFWSAGEDGRILQFDLRAPELNSAQNPRNVLIDLTTLLGYGAEAKCLAINPCRPEQLAVGANDPYVRLFDRRMLTCKAPSSTPSNGRLDRPPEDPELPITSACYYTAGHLPDKTNAYRRRFRALASTYVTFSPDGTGMLVNIGGEQIYFFSIVAGTPMRRKTIRDMISDGSSADNTAGIIGAQGDDGACEPSDASEFVQPANRPMPIATPSHCQRSVPKRILSRCESVKRRANKEFDEQRYASSIELYNEALQLNPGHAVLYCNRAAALIKRAWDGDIYAAMSDCLAALALDPEYVKAYYRLCKCLHALGWHKDVGDLLSYLRRQFPSHPSMTGDVAAIKEMEKAVADATKAASASEQSKSKAGKASQTKKNGTGDARGNLLSVPPIEATWTAQAFDYTKRFCGHCNTTTDIKEANFFGSNGQFVVAGSDDGSFFVWDSQTTNIVRVLRGDQSIVNCLQPHPSSCLLATSGIESVIRLWSPGPVDEHGNASVKNDRVVSDSFDVASANQKRMNADPIEVMLRSMGYDLTTTRTSSRSRQRGRAAAAESVAASGTNSSGGSSQLSAAAAAAGRDSGGSSEEEDEITMQCRQF